MRIYELTAKPYEVHQELWTHISTASGRAFSLEPEPTSTLNLMVEIPKTPKGNVDKLILEHMQNELEDRATSEYAGMKIREPFTLRQIAEAHLLYDPYLQCIEERLDEARSRIALHQEVGAAFSWFAHDLFPGERYDEFAIIVLDAIAWRCGELTGTKAEDEKVLRHVLIKEFDEIEELVARMKHPS